MSNESDFQQHKAAISAIDPKEVKHPNMPVGIYSQEAEDLFAWSDVDKERLASAGLEPLLRDSLPSRAGALRYAQSLWNSTRFSKEEAQREFAGLSPEAYDLRDRLVHHQLFAYRLHPDLKSRVQAIAEGSGDADMIQDLSDLAVHGRNNPEPLAAINFDMTLLDEAEAKSDELAALLGVARGEGATDSEAKITRDRAYTYLKQAVDEIREYGQYLFWRDETRKKGYASAHKRRTRSKGGDQNQTPEITDAP